MALDEEARVRQAQVLIREAEALIGQDDPKRLRVLIDMILLELQRELQRLGRRPQDRPEAG